LIAINKGDEYASPDAGWVAGTIDTDFLKALNTTKRAKYLEVWQQNVDKIFSETNLNKLEAAYGKSYRVAMENILHRMKTGRNRSFGTDTITGRFTDWLTNSVGAIMFFNTRSAVLQTISAVNFINFSDNNVLKAGQAFANQPQYWADFKKLFNPFLRKTYFHLARHEIEPEKGSRILHSELSAASGKLITIFKTCLKNLKGNESPEKPPPPILNNPGKLD